MNWKTWAPVAVAVLLGIVAVKVGKDMIARNGSGQSAMATAKAVILTADVPAGSAIKESDVTTGRLSAGAVPNGTFTDLHDVIGRVPQVAMVRGETVLENLLTPVGTMSGLPSLIPDGMRAVTIEVDEIRGVAGMLQPGCHIDLVSTIGGDASGNSTARSIVENLTVLAVGRRYSNSQPEADPAQGMARAITLLADPHQVDLIELATHMSNPRVVLRGSRDFAHSNIPGVTVAELRGKKTDTDRYATALTQMIRGKGATTGPATSPTESQEPTVYDVELIRNGTPTHVKMPLFNNPAPASTLVQNVQPPAAATPAPQNQPTTQPTAEETTPAVTPAIPATTQPGNSQASASGAPATQPSSGAVIRDASVDQQNAIPNSKN